MVAALAAATCLLPAAPAASAATCTVQLGGNCGAYSDAADLPPSNGFNTYVGAQSVGPQPGTTETLTASSPQSWSALDNDLPLGYTGVQTFDNVQQLTNNWCGTGWDNGEPGSPSCANPTDTPLAALPGLTVSYAAITPTGPNDIYELAPDVWTNYAGQLGGGTGDIMFWAYTTPVRCTDNGLSSADILGTTTLAGQDWTFYRYGPAGGEIVGILDSTDHDPVTNGTCARQAAGSIDVKGGLDWLLAQGFINTGPIIIGQLNTGFEVTSADNATFGFTAYSWTTGPGPSPSPTVTSPSPSPTVTSPSPTPTQTSPSPTPSPTPTRTCHRHHRHCRPWRLRWWGTADLALTGR